MEKPVVDNDATSDATAKQAKLDNKQRTDSMSIHSSVALLCAPVLIIVICASAVLLSLNQDDLSDFDDSAANYALLSGTLIQKLEAEKNVLVMHILSERSYEAGLKLSQAEVTSAINRFASYHYQVTAGVDTERRWGGIDGTGQLVYNVFVAALRQDELAAMRALAREYHATGDLGIVERVSRFYESVCRALLVMGGRQSAIMTEPFSRSHMALAGHLKRLNALANTQFASLWHEHSDEAAEKGASVAAALESGEELAVAESIMEAYAEAEFLTASTPELPQEYYHRLVKVRDGVQDLYEVPVTFPIEPQVGDACADTREELYTSSEAIHAKVEDAVDDHQDTLVTRMAALIVLIVVCCVGLAMHALNVLSYKNSWPLVHAAQKELVKLKKCLTRMQKFSSTCLTEDINEADMQTRIKQKGIPSAERTLLGTVSRIQQIKNYVPPAVYSERFKAFNDGQPFLDLGVRHFQNVVILCCDLGQLNAISPQDEVPFKLKAIEKSMGVFLSRIIHSSGERGGHLVDLTSDYAIMCWNFLTKRPKGEIDACATALDITEKIDPESDGVKPSIGIVTGDLVAGNAGIPTLKTFVAMGPGLSKAKHVQNLAMYYNLQIVIDGTCNEALSMEASFQTRPIDFITNLGNDLGSTEPGGESQIVPLHKLVTSKGIGQQAGDDNTDRSQMYTHYLDGDIKRALECCKRFQEKAGKSRVADRFVELCKAYPQVPMRNVHDLLDVFLGDA